MKHPWFVRTLKAAQWLPKSETRWGNAMSFYGHAEEAAQKIVRLFEDTNALPKPLAQVFIRRKDSPHFAKWSWGNQLLVCQTGGGSTVPEIERAT